MGKRRGDRLKIVCDVCTAFMTPACPVTPTLASGASLWLSSPLQAHAGNEEKERTTGLEPADLTSCEKVFDTLGGAAGRWRASPLGANILTHLAGQPPPSPPSQ